MFGAFRLLFSTLAIVVSFENILVIRTFASLMLLTGPPYPGEKVWDGW